MPASLHPGGVVDWLLVGLVAGCLAGKVMRVHGYGIIGDIVLGLIGAFVGGFLFSLFFAGGAGFWGSIGIAFLGACVLAGIARVFTARSDW
jgi:uncharacterized membrane protein YeaQ/YmgE (transglycosylase-associated protein family)